MKSILQNDSFTGLILADDLTGACDAAAPFAGRMQVLVALNADRLPRANMVSVNLGSRDIPVEAAKIKLQSASRLVEERKPQLFLKKVDSAFRGNTFQEIAMCLELLPHPVAVLAPAFPGMGRTVRSGTLYTKDLAGNSALDLVEGLRKHQVACSLMKSPSELGAESLGKSLLAAKRDNVRLILPDTETEADLNMLARVGLQLDQEEILWFGSGGLSAAFAQAQQMPQHEIQLHPHRSAGTILFCIGSDHPVTQRQIHYLKEEGDVVEGHFGSAACPDPGLALRNGTNVLLVVDTGKHDSEAIGGYLRAFAQHCGALVLSGGDTAAMVCDALAVETIALGGELLQGIPAGWLRGGPADGLTVVTKSGGFGAEDALLRIAQLLQSETRIKA